MALKFAAGFAFPGVFIVLPVIVTLLTGAPPIWSPMVMWIPLLLYWNIWLLVTAAVMLAPPSMKIKTPKLSDEPELAVAATPMVLLRTRALTLPLKGLLIVERTRIASPLEPFSVLLRMSTVCVPTAVVTTRLPPAAEVG